MDTAPPPPPARRPMLAEPRHRFKVALAFLTRLPVRLDRPPTGGELAASADLFPLVGALVGLAGAGAYALAWQLGLTSLLAAIAALGATALITGALHEDGLADTADGLGGGLTREDKLRIMRDARLGTYGALALGLVLAARMGALASLATPLLVGSALVAASAVSRALLPGAMAALPSARSDGLGAAAGRPGATEATLAAAVGLALALLLLEPAVALVASAAATLAGAAIALLAQRQIGGLTGDVLGAIQQASELAFLLAVVALAARA